jgi:hypothetical protein
VDPRGPLEVGKPRARRFKNILLRYDIHSSEGETLAQLGRARSKGGVRTRGAAFSKDENLSDGDTDESDVAGEYDEG